MKLCWSSEYKVPRTVRGQQPELYLGKTELYEGETELYVGETELYEGGTELYEGGQNCMGTRLICIIDDLACPVSQGSPLILSDRQSLQFKVKGQSIWNVPQNKYAIHAYTHGPVTGSGFMQL